MHLIDIPFYLRFQEFVRPQTNPKAQAESQLRLLNVMKYFSDESVMVVTLTHLQWDKCM